MPDILPQPAPPKAPTGFAHIPRSVRMSDLVGALSYALDITEGQPQGHAARTCLIGMRIAELMDLDDATKSDLFYGLLLKDLGCSSNASKMCYLFGADDRTIKRDLKTIDWAKMSQSVKFLREQVAPGGSTVERIMKIAAMAIQGPSGAKQLVQTRCERGADIARKMGFSEATGRAIQQLDEHWDGKGHPYGKCGEEIDPLARISGFAQTIEVFTAQLGRDAAIAMATTRSGTWFDPALVDIFLSIPADDKLWTQLTVENPHQVITTYEPKDRVFFIDEEGADRVAEAFGEVVDAKSPWTFKHSSEVAKIAVGISDVLGFSPDEQRIVRRMGLLHDVGKLGVSNTILDKPGRPTNEEFEALKTHPDHTQRILSQAGCFADVAELAAAHHEKLDGRGYHRGIEATQLPLCARLLGVADMYEAMTADRPYRDGMPVEKVLRILNEEAGSAICAESVEALEKWLERGQAEVRIDAQLQATQRLVSELEVD